MNDTAQEEMREEGLVIALQDDQAIVQTVQQDACAGCSVEGACHALGGSKNRQVPALNVAGAQVGDRVALGIGRGSVFQAGFLAYLVPVFALLAGAALGKALGPHWGFNDQTSALVVGVAALVAAWLGVRWLSNRLGQRGQFVVKVVAVLQRGEIDAVEQSSDCL